MARPMLRTSPLVLDDINQIKELFGSIANAQRMLALEVDIPMPEFRRALAFLPVRPEHAELIASRWAAWKAVFLRQDQEPTTFRLPASVIARDR